MRLWNSPYRNPCSGRFRSAVVLAISFAHTSPQTVIPVDVRLHQHACSSIGHFSDVVYARTQTDVIDITMPRHPSNASREGNIGHLKQPYFEIGRL